MTAALIILSILPAASAGERGAIGDLYVCNQIRHNVLQYDGMTGEYVGLR